MIKVFYGHTEKEPGSLAGVTHTEYFYNQLFARAIRDAWKEIGFLQGEVIENSNTISNWENIKERHRIGKEKEITYALEIHHNAGPGSIFTMYRRGCSVGKGLSRYLKDNLKPYSDAFGGKRWREVPLPYEGYRKKWIVQQSDFPCVILEAAKLTDPDQDAYFHNSLILMEYASIVARVLKSHYMGEEFKNVRV